MKNTLRIDRKNALMVAHRGLSGLEKENTNMAFVAAANRSYYGIETDIHPTADGRFVCIHDGNVKRVGIDNIDVESTTFDTLRAITLCDVDGKKGRVELRIPTLEEYIRTCRDYGKVGVLEIKGKFSRENLEKVVELIKAEEYLDGIIFIAFDIENLVILRELLPEQPCQYLISEFPDDLIDTLLKHRLDLDIYYPALTRENLDKCHENGIKVNVWTVDDPAEAEKFVSWGVDYITSNIVE